MPDLFALIGWDLEADVRKIAQASQVDERLLQAIAKAVAAGTAAGLRGAQGTSSAGAIYQTPPPSPVVVAAPLLPASINPAVIASQQATASDASSYYNSFGLVVPPLSTVVYTFGTGGLPTTVIGPMVVHPLGGALYDKQLSVQVTIDEDKNVVGPPSSPDFTIWGDDEVPLGPNYTIMNQFTIAITSLETVLTWVFFRANFLRMQPAFYNGTYVPLLTQFGFGALKGLLSQGGGTGA